MPLILDIEPPPGCLVRFISDLHLAHKRSAAPSPAHLVAQMEGVGMLVLCGDTAELRAPGAEQEKSLALREELRALCAQRGIQLIELAGNHDPAATQPMLARFWGGRVVATHGHAVPEAVSPWSREYLVHTARIRKLIAAHPESKTNLAARLELSRSISRELAAMETAAQPPAPHKRSLLHELYHCFWPPLRPLRIVWSWLTCGRSAERWLRRYAPETEVFIFGHFHRSGKWRYGRRTLLNTGAWFEHATPYAVDMQDAHLLRYFKMHPTARPQHR